MSLDKIERERRRARILAAARRCIIRHGFHGAGMAEICRACGMSAGNLYRYFPSKAAIIKAIADEIRLRIMPVFRRLENHADPVEGIVEIILFSTREFCRGSDARLWVEALSEASRNRLVRKLWIDFDSDMRDLLKSLLRRAIRTGQMDPRLDLEAASLWLVALLDGAMARVSVQPDVDLDRTLKTLAGSIRRCFCVQPSRRKRGVRAFSIL